MDCVAFGQGVSRIVMAEIERTVAPIKNSSRLCTGLSIKKINRGSSGGVVVKIS
jgi:hypothetical protein